MEADEGAPPAGAGWVGVGAPMRVGTGYIARDICDGAGWASPGRWSPSRREWRLIANEVLSVAAAVGTPELFARLALGRVDRNPFDQEIIAKLRRKLESIVGAVGHEVQDHPADRCQLPVRYRLMQSLLAVSENPEVHLGDFARGFQLGPGVKMPRLPALYRRKVKWALPSQRDPASCLADRDPDGVHLSNYSSVGPLQDKVREVLEDQMTRGQVIKRTETQAKKEFEGLVIASMGALRKEGATPEEYTARVLFDGTRSVPINSRIRLRDQERSPIAADLKRALRERSARKEPSMAITADIKEAHRPVPISPQDWAMLGCQLEKGGPVYIHTVGTFGVASASYLWSRPAGALNRLAQYVVGDLATTWFFTVADDFLLHAGGG